MYDKLFRTLIGMLGGLTKSANNGLNRDPAFGQSKTVDKIIELARETGDKSLLRRVIGMKGGLNKSGKYGLGRDPAKGQINTVRSILDDIRKNR